METGTLAILMLVPLVNMVILGVLASKDRPVLKELRAQQRL
jgi:hypothetical protein